jgi:thiol-disulfide isomerase/thioredoxin
MKELFTKDIQKHQGKFYVKKKPETGGMVIIKADWCGHCKRALPELVQVSKLTGSIFQIYKLDADKNKDIVNSMGITGFPTIRFIETDGQITQDYKGARDSKSILDEICTKARKCYGGR